MTLHERLVWRFRERHVCLSKQAIGLKPDHSACETSVLAVYLAALIELAIACWAKTLHALDV